VCRGHTLRTAIRDTAVPFRASPMLLTGVALSKTSHSALLGLPPNTPGKPPLRCWKNPLAYPETRWRGTHTLRCCAAVGLTRWLGGFCLLRLLLSECNPSVGCSFLLLTYGITAPSAFQRCSARNDFPLIRLAAHAPRTTPFLPSGNWTAPPVVPNGTTTVATLFW
jgi:hypothetical protein